MPATKNAAVHRWDEMETDSPMAKIDRRRIIGEHVMISDVFLHEGFSVASHAHANEQMAIVVSGRVKFGVGEGDDHREMTLCGGEVLHLPPNVPHSAVALADSRIFDIFSPVSEKTGIDQD